MPDCNAAVAESRLLLGACSTARGRLCSAIFDLNKQSRLATTLRRETNEASGREREREGDLWKVAQKTQTLPGAGVWGEIIDSTPKSTFACAACGRAYGAASASASGSWRDDSLFISDFAGS